jgi:peptidoglycan/LPS O-acetylase OafA/YrhL
MLRATLLAAHVAAGATGLMLGPPVLWLLARRRSTKIGRRLEGAYLLAVGAVCVTALGLVSISFSAFWWLAPVAALTGIGAYAAHRLRRAPRTWRARLLGGTYIALVTALLVVSVGGWLSWLLPSLIGAAAIEYVAARGDGSVPGGTVGRGLNHVV